MFILVKGVKIIYWGHEPIEPGNVNEVPFTVDDGGWIEQQSPNDDLYWDGVRFWAEPATASNDELSDAIAEIAAMAAENETAIDDLVSAVMELAEMVGGNENG